MLYIFPYVFALMYWVIFFVLTNAPQHSLFLLFTLLTVYIFTVGYIGRRFFFRQWNLWINFFLFLISSYGLVLIINSITFRNAFIIFSGFLGGLLVYIVTIYSRRSDAFFSRRYLEFISFIYLVTFWQLSILIYFGLLAYDTSIWSALSVFIPVTYLLGRGIISVHILDKKASGFIQAILVITTLEFAYFIELLPIHYFVLATILTIWFFFVLELVFLSKETINRKRTFSVYTLLSLAAMILILLTSKWG